LNLEEIVLKKHDSAKEIINLRRYFTYDDFLYETTCKQSISRFKSDSASQYCKLCQIKHCCVAITVKLYLYLYMCQYNDKGDITTYNNLHLDFEFIDMQPFGT